MMIRPTGTIGHPAADGNEDAEADHITRDGKLEGDGTVTEVARQNGKRRHDDRTVHVFHEHRTRDDQWNDECTQGKRHWQDDGWQSRRHKGSIMASSRQQMLSDWFKTAA
jgi:hypothetical protein